MRLGTCCPVCAVGGIERGLAGISACLNIIIIQFVLFYITNNTALI